MSIQRVGQVTLAKSVSVAGVGLHSGRDIKMTLHPAEEFTGIVFHRSDETAGANAILVSADAVVESPLCSRLKNDHGVEVGTVEHLLAALHGLSIDNVVVELNGPEVPVLDGSALPFVQLLEKAGRMRQDDPRKSIKVLKEIVVRDGEREARVTPADSFSLDIEIDYKHPLLPRQRRTFGLSEQGFKTDLAPARTFCFAKDIEAMRAQGLAKGGSLDNAVVMGDDGILNPGGLRFEDEALRHKALDCIGDFYLAGYPVLGAFTVKIPGHTLNNRLLRALMADKSAWAWVG